MSRFQRRVFLGILFLIVAALAGAVVLHRRAQAPILMRLEDGMVARYRRGTAITVSQRFPLVRKITVAGDVFLSIQHSTKPLLIETRLFRLMTTGGVVLRLTAYPNETGEQVEVLCGEVTAHKNYVSTYTEPDQLYDGQMSMVNQTIDLMEKETFDPSELRSWATQLGAEAVELTCR